jgi:hypothetical protein
MSSTKDMAMAYEFYWGSSHEMGISPARNGVSGPLDSEDTNIQPMHYTPFWGDHGIAHDRS